MLDFSCYSAWLIKQVGMCAYLGRFFIFSSAFGCAPTTELSVVNRLFSPLVLLVVFFAKLPMTSIAIYQLASTINLVSWNLGVTIIF